MRNNDLIKNFIYGEKSGKGSNLRIENNQLINYYTCIAYHGKNEIVLNNKNYSSTTKRHQNFILRSGTVVTCFDDEYSFKAYIKEKYNETVPV